MLTPFYFSDPNRYLYGCYHAPTGAHDKMHAILLVGSVGQESMRTHRQLRQFADNLSEAGFHVLRFDLGGNGDSWGDFSSVTFVDWVEDIIIASQELLSMSQCNKLSLIGLRFGALLCGHSVHSLGKDKIKINKLALWDPVTNGASYLNELMLIHEQMKEDSMRFLKPRTMIKDATSHELLGYLWPTQLRESIMGRTLTDFSNWPVGQSALFISSDRNEYQELLQSTHFDQHYQVDDAGDWANLDQLEQALIANKVTQKILDYLSGD